MFKKLPAARRVLIYMALSYIALVIVNNSTIEYENMWIIYTPMFIGVYVISRWIDSRLATQRVPLPPSSRNGGALGTKGSKDLKAKLTRF